MITISDVRKIIDLIRSMNNFLPKNQYTEYCFTDIMDYIIDWENKKYTYEDLEELEKIFHSRIKKSEFLNQDVKYSSKEIDEIYNELKNETDVHDLRDEISRRNIIRRNLILKKQQEKIDWVKNWVNRIEIAKEKMTENHKKI